MSDKKEVKTEDMRRSFEFTVDGEEKKYYIGTPSSEQIRKADWHYSKVYNKALVEGVATTSEMMDILTKRGIYGPDYEKKLQDLQVNLQVKVAIMGNEKDGAVKSELAKEIKQLRDQLFQWNQRITGPLSNSCEQMAEDAKTEYLTSAVVEDEEGNRLWESYQDFVDEENQLLAYRARFEVLLWLQGLDADFLEQTPENKVLRKDTERRAEEAAQKALQSGEPAGDVEAASTEDKPDSKKKARKPRATRKVRAKS